MTKMASWNTTAVWHERLENGVDAVSCKSHAELAEGPTEEPSEADAHTSFSLPYPTVSPPSTQWRLSYSTETWNARGGNDDVLDVSCQCTPSSVDLQKRDSDGKEKGC